MAESMLAVNDYQLTATSQVNDKKHMGWYLSRDASCLYKYVQRQGIHMYICTYVVYCNITNFEYFVCLNVKTTLFVT